jgi:hypothetical protein
MKINFADVFQAVSVLLFFLGLLFEDFWNSYKKYILIQPKLFEPLSKRKYILEFNTVLVKGILTTFLSLLLFYILFPTSIKIILSSKLSFWDFDIYNTLYVFLSGLLCFFVITSITITWKTYRHPHKNWPSEFK